MLDSSDCVGLEQGHVSQRVVRRSVPPTQRIHEEGSRRQVALSMLLVSYQLPSERRASSNVAGRALAFYLREASRMQSLSRPDGADVLGGKDIPLLHILNHK